MDPQQTKIYTAVIIACIIVGIIITFFVISLVQHQRRYIRVSRKNILAELSVLEKDRMRVAADLHDELSPILTAVKFQVDSIETINAEDKQTLVTTKEQLDNLASRLREISKDLMPASLTRKGLVPALEEYFRLTGKAHGIRIAFTHNITTELPEDKRINCYRIIQEITHNTVKHAKANTLLVQLTEKNNVLHVHCEDNGTGFHYDKTVQEESGLGLRNIRSRADIISENFNVVSIIGKGTQYNFDIPLN